MDLMQVALFALLRGFNFIFVLFFVDTYIILTFDQKNESSLTSTCTYYLVCCIQIIFFNVVPSNIQLNKAKS